MKKKIIFQKCNFNYIYFLFYILTYIVTLVIDNFFAPEEIQANDSKNEGYDIFYYRINVTIKDIFSLNVSDFIAIIPYLIRKKLSQSNNNNDDNNNNNESSETRESIKLIYNEESGVNIQRKYVILYLILIATLDFLKEFMFVLYYIIFPNLDLDIYPFSFTAMFDTILQFVFSYLILRIHFYKLQRFSLYLNIAILIIILIFDCIDIIEYNVIKGRIYVIFPFYLIFYCLEYVYGKKLILYAYISIYKLLIMKGIIKLFYNAIFSLIVLIVKKGIFIIFKVYFSELKYILLIIGKIIANFFNELFLWIIIDRFSPNHTPLILIGEEICNFALDLIFEGKFHIMGFFKYIRIVLYLISLFGVLLHNEIIVINVCGLGSDTKYFLDDIAKNEEIYNTTDDPDIIKRFETLEMIDFTDDESETN